MQLDPFEQQKASPLEPCVCKAVNKPGPLSDCVALLSDALTCSPRPLAPCPAAHPAITKKANLSNTYPVGNVRSYNLILILNSELPDDF